MKSDSAYPVSAEARGKLRTWKRRAAVQWAVFDRGFAGEAFVEASFDWAFKMGRGQARAVARMQSLLGEGAVREVPPAGGPSQIILWSIMRPREAVTKPLDLAGERVALGLLQPCTAVDYIIVWRDADVLWKNDGLWTLEAPDHAVGRVLQRFPGVNLTAIIRSAHQALLRVRSADALALSYKFLLPTPGGAFVVELVTGQDTSGRVSAHCRAHTWLHSDQLTERQERRLLAVDSGLPGQRLGDAALLPHPLRRIEKTADGLIASPLWPPGMPETLARPVGTG